MDKKERVINYSNRYQGSPKNMLFSSLCVYFGAVSFGYMIGYTSPALPMMEREGILDHTQASWFSSLVSFGAILGCFVAGYITQNIGRKSSLLIACVPYVVGWILIYITQTVQILLLGRIFLGLASGIVCATGPLYISETTTKDMRGMLGSGFQLSITVGILLVNSLGLVFEWRKLALVGFVIPFIGLLFTLMIPETPHFYLLRKQRHHAIKSLTFLRDPHVDIEEECRDIEENLDPHDQMEWSQFLKGEFMHPMKVAAGLMCFQQLSGINVLMFYTVSIFESAGFKETSMYAAIVISVVQVLGTVVACVLMDRLGRRRLLILAGMGMGMSCVSMGAYYLHQQGALDTSSGATAVSNLSWLALVSLVIYIMAFALGWGPIPMLVTSEIFPAKARGTASAIATAVSWSVGFFVVKEFVTLQGMVGQHGAFWFYGVCCFLSVAFVWKMVPETKGKSLEDIELYFLGRANIQSV